MAIPPFGPERGWRDDPSRCGRGRNVGTETLGMNEIRVSSWNEMNERLKGQRYYTAVTDGSAEVKENGSSSGVKERGAGGVSDIRKQSSPPRTRSACAIQRRVQG
jgi:hypothetical protein